MRGLPVGVIVPLLVICVGLYAMFGPHGADRRRAQSAPALSVATPTIDQRIAQGAILNVGQDGHTSADVANLRMGASDALTTRGCQRVELTGRSTSMPGAYYVQCDREPYNRFFRVVDGRVNWCERDQTC